MSVTYGQYTHQLRRIDGTLAVTTNIALRRYWKARRLEMATAFLLSRGHAKQAIEGAREAIHLLYLAANVGGRTDPKVQGRMTPAIASVKKLYLRCRQRCT